MNELKRKCLCVSTKNYIYFDIYDLKTNRVIYIGFMKNGDIGAEKPRIDLVYSLDELQEKVNFWRKYCE